jgi:hypothetical protein
VVVRLAIGISIPQYLKLKRTKIGKKTPVIFYLCHLLFTSHYSITKYYAYRHGGETIQLHLPTQPEHALQTFQPPTIEHKTLEQLLTMNPYDYPVRPIKILLPIT